MKKHQALAVVSLFYLYQIMHIKLAGIPPTKRCEMPDVVLIAHWVRSHWVRSFVGIYESAKTISPGSGQGEARVRLEPAFGSGQGQPQVSPCRSRSTPARKVVEAGPGLMTS